MKEESLSDKADYDLVNGKKMMVFIETDVKEFIKKLKGELWRMNYNIWAIVTIDKLAGDKLTGDEA